MTFREPHIMVERHKGEPVYLIMAMTADNVLRLKPQNLVTGLPIRHWSGNVSTALKSIPVGVVVERRKAASEWIDTSGGRSQCCLASLPRRHGPS